MEIIVKHAALALSVGVFVAGQAPALAVEKADSDTEARPPVSLKLYVGPAGELGNRGLTSNRTQTKTSGSVTTGTDSRTSTTTTSTPTTSTQVGGVGYQYGGDLTWWAQGRFGLGLGFFGANVPSLQTSTVLSLHGQDPSTYKNETKTESGGTTSSLTLGDSTTIASYNPFGGGGTTHTITIGIPAANATNALTTTYSATGVGTILTLRQGDTAATNPKSNFKSVGGMAFTNSRTFNVNDVILHGDYMLARGQNGEISLFGGVTVPIINARHTFAAKTVGDGGQGDSAKETELGFKADGAQTFRRVTETTINNAVTTDTSMLLAGPVFGLNASYKVTPTFGLFTQLGYAPVLGGSASTTTLTQTNSTVVATVTDATVDAPPGTTNGSTTTSTSTTTTTPAIAGVTGAAALGSLGGSLQVGPVTLFADGNARSYNIGPLSGVPEVIYGIRLGGGIGF